MPGANDRSKRESVATGQAIGSQWSNLFGAMPHAMCRGVFLPPLVEKLIDALVVKDSFLRGVAHFLTKGGKTDRPGDVSWLGS